MPDPVKHPAHYSRDRFGIECIDLTRHMDFCGGNVTVNLARALENGSPTKELKKARRNRDRSNTLRDGVQL